jgi:phosphoglycerol transferase MdoB-like AlkP superfamily enzyme
MGHACRSAHGASRGLTRRALWVCVSLLSLILIAVATRRILHLPSSAAALDAGFARHPLLMLAHVLAGLAFVLLGPFQFMKSLRKRRPSRHRWMGRIFLASALVIGVTALIMSLQLAIGGALESAATFTTKLVPNIARGLQDPWAHALRDWAAF